METIKHIDPRVIMTLKAYRHRLTRQQYATLRGQALAGDGAAAMKGLKKILERGAKND